MTGETVEAGAKTGGPRRPSAPLIEIEYFTDPLCCWSWGFEPQLRRLRFGFAGRIAWRLRMAGMIGSWERFDDPINSVHRPAQMGPLWIQAGTVTGMPTDPILWVEDPPASSWPACLAVRAAGLQSPAAADLVLRRIREAAMMEGRNVAREEVLVEIAREVSDRRPDLFDADRFRAAFAEREARGAFEEDMREARVQWVARYPCLVLRRSGAPPETLVGWRPYGPLLDAIRRFQPEIGEERRMPEPETYRTYWSGATDRELAEAATSPVAAKDMATGAHSSGAAGSSRSDA